MRNYNLIHGTFFESESFSDKLAIAIRWLKNLTMKIIAL